MSDAPLAVLDFILTPEPGRATPICKTVIAEERYRDRDHSKAVSAFYSRSFRDIRQECLRLHFFSRRLQVIDLADLEKHEKSYLGFCVLRPLPYRKIGRTVLAAPQLQSMEVFHTCQSTFKVHVGGSTLSFQGTCFMEQDTMVAACATTAIWMATEPLAHRFGMREHATAEITEIANQYLAQHRPMPSDGLLLEQMVHALRTMGYNPVVFGVDDQQQAKHLVYSYVESSIPPILLCRLASGGDHTVVAVAHGYEFPVKTRRRLN